MAKKQAFVYCLFLPVYSVLRCCLGAIYLQHLNKGTRYETNILYYHNTALNRL